MTRSTSRAFRGVFLYLFVVAGCVATDPRGFEHDVPSTPTPWTHNDFDAADGKFTFAIISDLTGGERDRVFEVAIQQLSLLRPELILSVGDLIEGESEDHALLAQQWDDFDARAMKALAPLFRVGGNHDLEGMALRPIWAERYGPRYYHFVYRNVLFLVLDTEDHTVERMREIDRARDEMHEAMERGDADEDIWAMEYYQMPEITTGNIGPEQSAYFLEVLDENPQARWTMLFLHKPVWLEDGDPDFVAIESALSDRPYTVFNGHLHAMSHTVRNGRDYIHLGTTGGAQRPSHPMSFDHVSLVTVADDGPSIVHLRLDGILDKTGQVPGGGANLCFQASVCGSGR